MIWAVLVLIGIAVVLVAGFLLFQLALNPRVNKRRVFSAPHNVNYDVEAMKQRGQQARDWWAGVAQQRAEIQSHDGLTLRAHVARHPENGRDWAILCHGYTSKGLDMLPQAQGYYQAGYSLLLPDLRAHGESEGRHIGMGWMDRLDMVKWIDQVLAYQPDARIVLHGVSMGGATVMMTAGEDLPDNVRAVVSDCGFSDMWTLFSYQLKGIFGLPPFPLMHAADLFARLLNGFSMREGSAVAQLKKARVPVLFIHGEQDTFVPFAMLEEVYAACVSPKEKFVVPGAGHGECYIVAGDEYWQRILQFIDRVEIEPV